LYENDESSAFICFADTVKMRDVSVGSAAAEEELREYDRCMKWFDECSRGVSGFNHWYLQKEEANKDERKVREGLEIVYVLQ
jgi:hypothetical protein